MAADPRPRLDQATKVARSAAARDGLVRLALAQLRVWQENLQSSSRRHGRPEYIGRTEIHARERSRRVRSRVRLRIRLRRRLAPSYQGQARPPAKDGHLWRA